MSAGTGKQKKQRKPFSAVVKFILAAGAVAAAITAIIALVMLLLPDDEERLSAEISQVKVDPKVPLAEFLEQSGEPSDRQTAAIAVFVSASTAQYRPRTVVPPPPIQPPPPVVPPPVNPPPVAPQPPPGSKIVGGLLDKLEKAPFDKVIQFKLHPTDPLPKNAVLYMKKIVTDTYDAPPDEVRQMLEGSRLRVSHQSGGPAKLSPIGVVVNFSAQIEGFKGEKSIVRWSLFDAREETRMPQSWLRNRKALELVPEAGSDNGSQSIWVPLPRKRGPYFVRLELFDDDGERLALADSKSFDRR